MSTEKQVVCGLLDSCYILHKTFHLLTNNMQNKLLIVHFYLQGFIFHKFLFKLMIKELVNV